jgi:hypothetical protein
VQVVRVVGQDKAKESRIKRMTEEETDNEIVNKTERDKAVELCG